MRILNNAKESIGKILFGFENWVEQHAITRFLTSYVVLSFFYGLFLFLYEIVILREIVPAVHPFLIVWAGGLAGYNLIVKKGYKKIAHWKALALFTIICVINVIVNREAGIVGNVKSLVMTLLPLFAFLPTIELSGSKKEEALIKSMLGGAIVIFIASLVALVMYLLRYSQIVIYTGIENTLGFRYYIPNDPQSGVLLFGIYEDTNHAALYSLIFAVYSIYLYNACQKGLFLHKWQNVIGCVFAVLSFIVQICYFPLANSRGGWLGLLLAAVLTLFLLFFCKKLQQKSTALRAVEAFAMTVVCVAVICFGLIGVRTGISKLSHAISETSYVEKAPLVISEKTGIKLISSAAAEQVEKANNEVITDEKKKIGSDSFAKENFEGGAGRIAIWKGTIELFFKRPIWGTGPNHHYYSMKYDVAKDTMGSYKAVHSSYLDLLLDYGLLGFVCLMSFWALCLRDVIKKCWNNGNNVGYNYYAIAFCVLLEAIIVVFLSSVFISTTAAYFIMLIMTGYLMSSREDEQDKAM